MADDMSLARRLVVCTIAAFLPAAAGAQALSDPTRPPAGLTGAAGDPGLATGGPVLQSVMISASGNAAIISGEMVRLGDKFGAAQVVRISENEVVLKDGSDEQVLRLYPEVEKSSVAAGDSKAPNQGSRADAGKPGDARSAPGGAKR